MKSLVQVTLSICLFLPFLAFGQIIEKPNCFQCDGNQAKGYKSMASGLGNTVFGNYAAGLGQNNISNGIGSLAAGVQCEASGDYAQAFGNIVKATARSSFASGFLSEAHGVFSVAMGYGAKTGSHSAIALGFNVEALAPASFVTGRYVKSTASNAITMGSGNDNAEYLSNNLPGTLMVGFNSIYPTLFVSRAPGGGNKTGRIGIGNITVPTAKLHIRADENEDASIMLQPAGNTYSGRIFFGDNNHSISGQTGANLVFKTGSGNHFAFINGNAGFGTGEPAAKIQIKNGDIFIEDVNRGIIMKSPDGNCWRGTVNNQGMMEFAPIDCNTLQTGTSVTAPDLASAVKIYPNPAGNQIFISCDANFDVLQLEITNLSGRLISTQKLSNPESFIDLSAYQPGTYIFRLTDENGKRVATQKVIKE